jgi:hypothetical protein
MPTTSSADVGWKDGQPRSVYLGFYIIFDAIPLNACL